MAGAADRVREAVRTAVATDAGLRVVEVNVTVADVHDPADDVPPTPAPEAAAEPDPASEPTTAEPEPEPTTEPNTTEPEPVADQVVVAERVVVVQAGDQPTA